MSLRTSLIRLAHSNAALRPHLLSILASEKEAMEFPTQEALEAYLKEHPGADKSKHKVKKPDGRGPSKIRNVDTDADGHYVKKLRHPGTDKFVKTVEVEGKGTYDYNPAYKTYNSRRDNELLTSKDVAKIKW